MGVPAHLDGLLDLVVEAIVRDLEESEAQMKTAPPSKESAVSNSNKQEKQTGEAYTG